jgi:transposase
MNVSLHHTGGLLQNRLTGLGVVFLDVRGIWDDWWMAKRYRPVDRDQPFLLPPDMRDWLPADHPVWLVITVVDDHLDTSVFHTGRKIGGAGAAGYDPDMLVMVLVWAYAHQVTSSRRIEALCGTDVAFKVICAGNTPDHVTIARFRAGFPAAIGVFFAEVLALCARLGMGKLGVVALDGMKIAANASKSANRAEETLRKMAAETVAAHAAADAAEDEVFGEGCRGDEVPAEVWSPRRRGERIAAALASVRAEREAAEKARQQQADAYLEAAGSGQAPAGNIPAAALAAAAAIRLDQAVAAQQAKIAQRERRDAAARAAGHRGYRGKRPAPEGGGVRKARARLQRAQARAAEAEAAAAKQDNGKPPGPVRNITDPDARLMPVRGGTFIEGYNAQNVTSEDGLIIATELTQDTTDFAWFEPMLRRAQDAAAFLAARQPARPDHGHHKDTGQIGLFLADAGYLSEHNLTIEGPDRLIATGKTHDLEKAARDGGTADRGRTGPATTAMAARLATPGAITAYRQRSHIAETPHGQIKHNMRFRQLSVRGKPKATAEWAFTCTVHNLFKAITTKHLTTTTLATLPTATSPA